MSDKYDITRHPNYKYLADADKKNKFDIERYLSTQLKPRPDDFYDVYEINGEGDEESGPVEDTEPLS